MIRVQRVPDAWPLVHLEEAPPDWRGLAVEGLVRHRRALTRSALESLGAEERFIPVHCVWGWSRPACTWTGVGLDVVLDLVGAHGDFVTLGSASGTYSACLPVADARRGFLAWARDGETLGPEAGGPLRFVCPPTYWAYKSVKWAASVVVADAFVAGFWESKVADPFGRIPEEVLLP